MYKITDEKIKKAKRKLEKMTSTEKWKLVEESFGMWAKTNCIDGNANWEGFSLTNH